MQELTDYKEKTGKTWIEIAEMICVTARQLRYIRRGQFKPSKAVQKLIDNLIDSIKER
jgi:hypothetical protein